MFLQLGFLRDQGVLELPELRDLKRAVGKSSVKTVYLGLDVGKLVPEPVNASLFRFGQLAFPGFDAGQELLLPFVGNDEQLGVSLDLLGERLFAQERAVIAVSLLVLVGATIVAVATTALLGVPFGGNAVPARATGGKVEKQEPLFASALSGLADGYEGGLDLVKRLLGDHGNVHSLVQFAFVPEHAVVKWIAEKSVDGRQRQGLATASSQDTHSSQLPLKRRERELTGCEMFEGALHLLEMTWVGFDGAEPGFIVVSKRRFTGKDAAADLLADSALDVYREVTDVLIGHAQLDRNHEHVIARQV